MSKIKVLIIDDEPPARDLVKHYLNDFPALEIAGECENGFEALQAIQELKPQLIFLDIQMPEMDGLEATRFIRTRLPSASQPKIVAMTAYAMKGDREQCLAVGMDDYISKPIEPEVLIEKITALI